MAEDDLKKEHNDKTLIQTIFPQTANLVFFAAIFVGLVLIVLPTLGRSYFAVNGTQANLVLCIGAALVLAAFGGQATFRLGGLIMAGAAAIAVGLFSYLQWVVDTQILQGRVTYYDRDKYKDLEISNRSVFLGAARHNAENPKRSSYEFVAFKSSIQDVRIEVKLVTHKNMEEVLFVNASDIEWAFGNRQRLEWVLREQTVDGEKRLGLFDTFKNDFVSRPLAARIEPGSKIASTQSSIFVREAAAQESSPNVKVSSLIGQLKSDDTVVRRGARDELTKAPVAEIPTIMSAFKEEYSDYKVKLGVSVALSQKIRADPGLSKAISDKLSVDDVDRLLNAAGDPDRTIRTYAADFLSGLADPRVTKMAINRAATMSDESIRYNWLLSAQGGWEKLSDTDKKALLPLLVGAKSQTSSDKTKRLIEKLK